jgi:GNAT superfamily N-acetyltransferase
MPRNTGDFHQYTFRYAPGESNDVNHVVTATHPDHDYPIGFLVWKKDTGETLRVDVEKEHQRKGVATGMWNFAKNVAASSNDKIRRPQHSRVQTKSGKAWAKKVGK